VIVNGGTLESAAAADGFYRASSYTVNNGGALTGLGGSAFGYGPMASLTVNAGGTFQTGFQEMGNLTLNGGTINLNTAGSFGGNSLALSRDVTVGGSSASIFQGNARLALNIATNPEGQTRAFDVADATGNSNADLIISSVVHNAHVANGTPGGNLTNLEKKGAGTMQLSGNNTYSGSTIVSAGTLLISGTGSINSTSEILVSAGATLQYNSTTALTKDLNLGSGAALGGSGVVGNVNLASGSLLKPGNSPGTLTAASATILGGSTYKWEIANLTGDAGTNWDLFSVTGLMDMSGVTSLNKWNLEITGDSGFTGWTGTGDYSYVFAQAASVSGFSATVGTDVTSLFNITTSGITGLPNSSYNANGDFKVVVGRGAGDLTTLNLMAIPEPSTGSLMTFGLGGLVLTRLLRRKVS
jgi:autotransporter-associated beta strand protein